MANKKDENYYQAQLEGKQCNNDISEQIAFEEKIAIFIKKANQVEKQLIEVKYYLEQFDDDSAKIKSRYLLKAVKELNDSFD